MTEPDVRGEALLDELALSAWAERLGASLRGGDVVLLRGPMGAGKTTFTRALARGLGVLRPERVCSPTYTVCMIHAASPASRTSALVHLDLFRLGEGGPIGAAAFEALGLEHDELPGPDRTLVVEWSELWLDPPAEQLRITLARSPELPRDHRSVRVEGFGRRWIEALEQAPLTALSG